jgi:predicted DNA-binding transcriptional regulator AlpA
MPEVKTESESKSEIFITAPQLFERWQCSHMFVVARLRDDSDFPKPIFFGRHRRWRLADIEAYEKLLAKRPAPKAKKQNAA